MVTCTSCGSDVTGRKFCARCGTAVQPASVSQEGGQFCSHCHGEVKPGAAFCMHCGASLRAQPEQSSPQLPVASARFCPTCNAEVAAATPFCTNCGHNLNGLPQVAATPSFLQCVHCGRQNAPDVRFCGGCGNPLGAVPAVQPNYAPQGQYPQYPQSQQQYAQPQYQQQYPPQQYAPQGGYQPQPMMGQGPMMLHCPVCMAMAPLGTAACVSCRTSLAGVVPMPANMPMQGQQAGGLGGFMQGNGGKYAMGALGGAAAVIGGEMLMNGMVGGIENRVEGDMGYGGGYQHHHRRREEGLLGGLGELADDIGL